MTKGLVTLPIAIVLLATLTISLTTLDCFAQQLSMPVNLVDLLQPNTFVDVGGLRLSKFSSIADNPIANAASVSAAKVGNAIGLTISLHSSFLSTMDTQQTRRFALSFEAERLDGDIGHGIVTIAGDSTGASLIQAGFEMRDTTESAGGLPAVYATAVQSGFGHIDKSGAIASFAAGVHRANVRLISEAALVGAPGLARINRLQFLIASSGPLAPAGDYNFDNAIDGLDFAIWQRQLGSRANLEADGDNNGVVDGRDLAIWRDSFGTASGLLGDFDRDGHIDGQDFLLWQRALGTANASIDVNKNGLVDVADLQIWRDSFVSLGSTNSSVPEPTGRILLVLGLAVALAFARAGR